MTSKTPAEEPEFVVPDAALPEQPADPVADPGAQPTQVLPSDVVDPLAPSAPPAPAYAPPVYQAPGQAPAAPVAGGQPPVPPAAPTYGAPAVGAQQPAYAQQPGAPVPPAPPAGPGAAYGQQAPGAPKKTNVLAIVAFISAFFVSLLAIILGHISLSQIKKTGEGGRGLALAGTILGYVFSFGWIAVIIAVLASAAFVAANVESLEAEIQQQLEQMEESGELPEGIVPFDEEEDNFDDWAGPWVGTENEAFCEAWDFYPDDSEAHKYLLDVAAQAPTEEMRATWQALADEWGASTSNPNSLAPDFWDRYEEADMEVDELCFQY